MSEILTEEEIKDLREKPSDLEMGELRKIATLQDIPLTEGIVGGSQLGNFRHDEHHHHHHVDAENERKSKTNSLKRFFRLPNKKKSEGRLEGEQNGDNFKKDSANISNSNKMSGARELTGSFSKHAFKTSFNSYFNAVFKQKKSKKSPKSDIELKTNLNEPSCSLPNVTSNDLQDVGQSNPEEKCVLQEIQSLQISQDYNYFQ